MKGFCALLRGGTCHSTLCTLWVGLGTLALSLGAFAGFYGSVLADIRTHGFWKGIYNNGALRFLAGLCLACALGIALISWRR